MSRGIGGQRGPQRPPNLNISDNNNLSYDLDQESDGASDDSDFFVMDYTDDDDRSGQSSNRAYPGGIGPRPGSDRLDGMLPLTQQSLNQLALMYPGPDSGPNSIAASSPTKLGPGPYRGGGGERKIYNVFQRLQGKKITTPISANPESGSSSSFKDGVLSFFTGETEQERKTRLRLNACKLTLQNDVNLLGKIKQQNHSHRHHLMKQFQKQELQIQKWGMIEPLPLYRLQAWLRVSRAILIEDTSNMSYDQMIKRLSKCQKIIQHFHATRGKTNPQLQRLPLSQYNDFCLTTEAVLARDKQLSAMGYRLSKFDKLCSVVLNRFRKKLAACQNQTFLQKVHAIQDMIKRYSIFMNLSFPMPETAKEGNELWLEYVKWYSARLQKMGRIEKDYIGLIEDNRDREGRLFLRWCSQILSSATATASEDTNTPVTPTNLSPVKNNPQTASILSEEEYHIPQDAMLKQGQPANPRSIRAFIRYFATQVIAHKYNLPEPHDTILALTETAVYRRINAVIFRYPNEALFQRDVKWRNQCSLCQMIDPVQYGVMEEYIYGPPVPPTEPPSPVTATTTATVPLPPSPTSRAAGGGKKAVENFSTISLADTESIVGTYTSISLNQQEAILQNIAKTVPVGAPITPQAPKRVPSGLNLSLSNPALSGLITPIEISSVAATQKGEQNPQLFKDFLDLSLHTRLCNVAPDMAPYYPTSRSAGAMQGSFFDLNGLVDSDLQKTGIGCPIHATSTAVGCSIYSKPYARAARLLHLITRCVSPREITFHLLQAIRWILFDAASISQSSSAMGADMLIPLIVTTLIHANLPHIHLVLHYLHHYFDYDSHAETAYYATCFEAAMTFITRIQLNVEYLEMNRHLQEATSSESGNGGKAAASYQPASSGPSLERKISTLIDPSCHTSIVHILSQDTGDEEDLSQLAAMPEAVDDDAALDKLSQWVRDQNTMEETISILQKEGWMV